MSTQPTPTMGDLEPALHDLCRMAALANMVALELGDTPRTDPEYSRLADLACFTIDQLKTMCDGALALWDAAYAAALTAPKGGEA